MIYELVLGLARSSYIHRESSLLGYIVYVWFMVKDEEIVQQAQGNMEMGIIVDLEPNI